MKKLMSWKQYEEWLVKMEAALAKETSRKAAEEILKEEESTFEEVKWSEAFPEAVNAKKRDRKKEEPTQKAPQNRKRIITSEDLAKEIEAEELEQKVIELEEKKGEKNQENQTERLYFSRKRNRWVELKDLESGLTDLNTASLEELAKVPGLSEKKAQAIIERRKVVAFKSDWAEEQILDIQGIGEKTLEKIFDHITISKIISKKQDIAAEAVNHTGGDTEMTPHERAIRKHVELIRTKAKEGVAVLPNDPEELNRMNFELIRELSVILGLPRFGKSDDRVRRQFAGYVLRRLGNIESNDGSINKNQVSIGGWHDNQLRSMLEKAVAANLMTPETAIKLMEMANHIPAWWADARLDKKFGITPLPDRELIDGMEGRGIAFGRVRLYLEMVEDSGIFWDNWFKQPGNARPDELEFYVTLYPVLNKMVKAGLKYTFDVKSLASIQKMLKPLSEDMTEGQRRMREVSKQNLIALATKLYERESRRFKFEDFRIDFDELIKMTDEEIINRDGFADDLEFTAEEAFDYGTGNFVNWCIFQVEGHAEEKHALDSREDKVVVSFDLIMKCIEDPNAKVEAYFKSYFRLKFGPGYEGLEDHFVRHSNKLMPFEVFEELKKHTNNNAPMFFGIDAFENYIGAKIDGSISGSPNNPGSCWVMDTFDFDAINPGRNLTPKSRYNYLQLMVAGQDEKLPEAELLEYIDKTGKRQKELPGNEMTVALVNKSVYLSEAMKALSLIGSGIIVFDPRYRSAVHKLDANSKTKGVTEYVGGVKVEVYLKEYNTMVRIAAFKDDQKERKVQENAFFVPCLRADTRFSGKKHVVDVRDNETNLKTFKELFEDKLVGEIYINGKATRETATVVVEKIFSLKDQSYEAKIDRPSGGYTSSLLTMKFNSLLKKFGEKIDNMDLEEYLGMEISTHIQKKAYIAKKLMDSLALLESKGFIFGRDPYTLTTDLFEDAKTQKGIAKFEQFRNKMAGMWVKATADYRRTQTELERSFKTQDWLLINGALGKDTMNVYAAYRGHGKYAALSEMDRARFIHDTLVSGISLRLPWLKTEFSIQLFNPVYINQEGEVNYSQDLRELFFVLKGLAGAAFATKKEATETLAERKAAYKFALERFYILQERTLNHLADALIHRRGFAIAGRHFDGAPTLNKVLVPLRTFLKFAGWVRKDGNLVKLSTLDDVSVDRKTDIQMRLDMLGKGFVKALDALCERYSHYKQSSKLEDKINILLRGKKVTVLRHPQAGHLPTSEMQVRKNIRTIVVPNHISARYTGINGDSDGDIIYIIPLFKEGDSVKKPPVRKEKVAEKAVKKQILKQKTKIPKFVPETEETKQDQWGSNTAHSVSEVTEKAFPDKVKEAFEPEALKVSNKKQETNNSLLNSLIIDDPWADAVNRF